MQKVTDFRKPEHMMLSVIYIMLRDNVAPKTVYVWLIYSAWIDNEFVMAYLEHRKEPELGTDLPTSTILHYRYIKY